MGAVGNAAIVLLVAIVASLAGFQAAGIGPHHLYRGICTLASDLASTFITSAAGDGTMDASSPVAKLQARQNKLKQAQSSLMPFEKRRVFSPEELLQYNGKGDASLPVYLVCLGEVFDVSAGRDKYVNGGYAIFLGQESSASFHTGKFDSPQPDVSSLADYELLAVGNWRKFYRAHDTYFPVGVMGPGLYFDEQGRETAYWHAIEARIIAAGADREAHEAFMSTVKPCNMKYTHEAKSTVVNCNAHPGTVPRIMTHLTKKWGEKREQRCACVGAADTPADVGGKDGFVIDLTPYPGCDVVAATCVFEQSL